MSEYLANYLKAIKEPLPELQETFEAELNFFKEYTSPSSIVLDVGCGAGRPAIDLATSCKTIVAIDNSPGMLTEARKAAEGITNIEILEANALSLPFDNEEFDFTYGTYNLLGSLSPEDRQQAVNEMYRVAKQGSAVANLTWKHDASTTQFLQKYYPHIGINIISSNENETVTDKGAFQRLSVDELQVYYKEAGFKDIQLQDIGEVWIGIVGRK